MASSSYSLVSAHTSSVFVHTPDVVNVSSRGTHPNPKGSNKTDDLVSDHASYATVFSNSQAQILFRLINNSRTIELTSLTDHVPPIHYHFPSPVLPSPGIIFDDPEIHVIACTVDGSVFRLVFSLPDLWTVTVQREGRRVYNNWCHEYSLKTSVANLQGPVHVKEAATVFIGLKDGGILRLQAFRTNGGFGGPSVL
jgi:nuclear pore complex protein Nup160